MTVTVTSARRKRAINLIRHSNVSRLDREAQIVYAVSLLICDDAGLVDREALETAATDAATRAVASEILRRALR